MDIGPLVPASQARPENKNAVADDAAASFASLLDEMAGTREPRWIPRASRYPEGVEPVGPVADGEEPERFLDHVVIGRMDGLPVIEETPEEEAKAVNDLMDWAESRGQNMEETTFIKGNTPVFDEKTGAKIGYRIVTAMSLPMPPLCDASYERVALPRF